MRGNAGEYEKICSKCEITIYLIEVYPENVEYYCINCVRNVPKPLIIVSNKTAERLGVSTEELLELAKQKFIGKGVAG